MKAAARAAIRTRDRMGTDDDRDRWRRGGHLIEWSRRALRQPPPARDSEPWEHPRQRRFKPNTYLNELTGAEYRELFGRPLRDSGGARHATRPGARGPRRAPGPSWRTGPTMSSFPTRRCLCCDDALDKRGPAPGLSRLSQTHHRCRNSAGY
jgi:hypothetical protein